MAFSLKGPAYCYRTGVSDRIIYDRLWDRLIHFPSDCDTGFYWLDVGPITSQRESQLHQGAVQHERLHTGINDGTPGWIPVPQIQLTGEDDKEGSGVPIGSVPPLAETLEAISDVRFAPDDYHVVYLLGSDLWITTVKDLRDFAGQLEEGRPNDEKCNYWGTATNGGCSKMFPLRWRNEPHFKVLTFFWCPIVGGSAEVGRDRENPPTANLELIVLLLFYLLRRFINLVLKL